MKKIEISQMENLNGGTPGREKATGLMCGAAVGLLFAPGLQPLSAAFGVGCAIGIFL